MRCRIGRDKVRLCADCGQVMASNCYQTCCATSPASQIRGGLAASSRERAPRDQRVVVYGQGIYTSIHPTAQRGPTAAVPLSDTAEAAEGPTEVTARDQR